MTTVVDFYSRQPLATLTCLKAGGVDGIARYLTNSLLDVRQITRDEVADAHQSGLSVHFFYEMNPTYPGYFTFAQGAFDCQQAQFRLKDLGAPDHTVVYFTVDTNIDPNVTIPYFNGVESVQTPAITPGVYGFQSMVEFARTQFPNLGKHLAQTYGTQQGPLDLWQYLQEVRCGVNLDVNECSVAGWEGGSMVSQADFEAYKQALQKQLDATYERIDALEKATPHTHDLGPKTGPVST